MTSETHDPKLDFSKLPAAEHSMAGARKLAPQTIPNPLAMSQTGGEQFSFLISPGAIIPGRCRVNFKLTVTKGANQADQIWYHNQSLGIWKTISAQLESGFQLCQIDQLDRYLAAVLPAETKFNDFLHSQVPLNDSVADIISPFDGLRTANYRPDANAALVDSKSYLSPRLVTIVPADTDLELYYSIPLSELMINTPMGSDRVLYCPKNLELQFTLNGFTRLGFTSRSATNPTTNTAALVGASLSEVSMTLYYEKNINVLNHIVAAVNNGHMDMLVPYVRVLYNSSQTSTSQNLALRINSSAGDLKMRRLYTQLYNTTASGQTAFDHSTAKPTAGGTAFTARINTIVDEYLNFSKLQDMSLQISDTKWDDWNEVKNLLKGSAVTEVGQYRYSWFWPRVFDSEKTCEKSYTQSAGIPLVPEEANYSIQTECANGTYQWLVHMISERKLVINRDGMAYAFN